MLVQVLKDLQLVGRGVGLDDVFLGNATFSAWPSYWRFSPGWGHLRSFVALRSNANWWCVGSVFDNKGCTEVLPVSVAIGQWHLYVITKSMA